MGGSAIWASPALPQFSSAWLGSPEDKQPSLAPGSGIWAQGSAFLVIMLTAPAPGASHAQGATSLGPPFIPHQ